MPREILEKLVAKLSEYDFDDDLESLLDEARDILNFTKERAVKAAAAAKASGKSGRRQVSEATIRTILASNASLREIARQTGLSHEAVRRIRRRHNQG